MSLTLSPTLEFLWNGRLLEERSTRNITALHVRIGELLCRLLEAGETSPAKAELAAACRCSLTAVKDALRRLGQLGLLGWERQYVAHGGRRRQIANRYWLTLPEAPAVARPEIRRHRAVGVRPPQKEERFPLFARQSAGEIAASLAAVRARMEARLLGNKRGPPQPGG